MKSIHIERLALRNFKGVASFELIADGENVKVYGDNATGKTTLFDAFTWLLFDKDSQNKKEFSIKTLKNGKAVSMLEHEVECTLKVDGETITLRKIFAEKWTRKRGQATAEFSGHTTDFFVNDVPVKKKEYAERVDSVVQEDIFKLLTSPQFFNEQLKWQQRRETLLEICGDVTEAEVIASNKELEDMPAILQGRSIEDVRKIIASKRTDINKELDKIPVRIDEISKSIEGIEDTDSTGLKEKLADIEKQIDEKLTLINSIRNGNSVLEKEKQLHHIDTQLLDIKRTYGADVKEKTYQLKARLQEEKSNVSLLESKWSEQQRIVSHIEDNIARHDNWMAQLRADWHVVNKEEFSHTDQCECPTCGQSLPEEEVEAAKEKALAAFNLSKSDHLEKIKKQGTEAKEQKELLVSENEKVKKKAADIETEISKKKELVAKLSEDLQDVEVSVVDVTESQEYIITLREKQTILEQISQLKEHAEQSVQDVEGDVIRLKVERDKLNGDMAKMTGAVQAQARIQELEERERELAAEFESLEQQLYMTEEFIRSKVNLLEEKINRRFKYARFKLFETQINGGLQEVCETTYEGVPYGSGLNNAARINVGLDIINTLSEHYGIQAPIFIDNREAVTRLIETNAQTVSLIVSEQDKALRIEKQHIEAEAV